LERKAAPRYVYRLTNLMDEHPEIMDNPICNARLHDVVGFARTIGNSPVLNPEASAFRSYFPGSSRWNENLPSSLVCAAVSSVPFLRIVTFAFTIGLPKGSSKDPQICRTGFFSCTFTHDVALEVPSGSKRTTESRTPQIAVLSVRCVLFITWTIRPEHAFNPHKLPALHRDFLTRLSRASILDALCRD
jgi:hypothetical protein